MTVTSTKITSLVVGEVVVAADLAELVAVLGPVAGVGLVGDQPDRAAGAVADEELGGRVEGDAR